MKNKKKIALLSANKYSAYSSSVLYLALKENIKVDHPKTKQSATTSSKKCSYNFTSQFTNHITKDKWFYEKTYQNKQSKTLVQSTSFLLVAQQVSERKK